MAASIARMLLGWIRSRRTSLQVRSPCLRVEIERLGQLRLELLVVVAHHTGSRIMRFKPSSSSGSST
jgi:hypothetical protein